MQMASPRSTQIAGDQAQQETPPAEATQTEAPAVATWQDEVAAMKERIEALEVKLFGAHNTPKTKSPA